MWSAISQVGIGVPSLINIVGALSSVDSLCGLALSLPDDV